MRNLLSARDRILRIQAREYLRDPSALKRLLLASAGDRAYSVDANMFLADGAAAQTADGFSQYGGADGVIDLGGNQGITITLPSIADVSSITPQQPRIDAMLLIDISAIDISSGNETYRWTLIGSNDPAFGTGTGVCLCQMEIGKGASLSFSNAKDFPTVPSAGGLRLEVPFTNEQANVKLQYAKLWLDVGGTTPSVTYKAGVCVLPEP